MGNQFTSKHLIAKEYQLPIVDKIFEVCQLPFDKNPFVSMLGESQKLPRSQKVTITGMDGNNIDLYIWRSPHLTRKGLVPDSPQTTLYNQLRIPQIKRMLGE